MLMYSYSVERLHIWAYEKIGMMWNNCTEEWFGFLHDHSSSFSCFIYL